MRWCLQLKMEKNVNPVIEIDPSKTSHWKPRKHSYMTWKLRRQSFFEWKMLKKINFNFSLINALLCQSISCLFVNDSGYMRHQRHWLVYCTTFIPLCGQCCCYFCMIWMTLQFFENILVCLLGIRWYFEVLWEISRILIMGLIY